jgi:hypothetical protein
MNFNVLGLDFRKCLSARARNFFRSLDAKDDEAASDCLFYLDDQIVFLLNRHLERNVNWLGLRGPNDDKFTHWWIDFLTKSRLLGVAGEFIRLTSIACWYAGADSSACDGRQPVEFQLFMDKGEYRGFTLGFGDRELDLFRHISPIRDNWTFWFAELPEGQLLQTPGGTDEMLTYSPQVWSGDREKVPNRELARAVAANDLDAIEMLNQQMNRYRENLRKGN